MATLRLLALALLLAPLAACSRWDRQKATQVARAAPADHATPRILDVGPVPEPILGPAQRPVSTVVNPDAPARPLSLNECICLALENGRTGEFYDRVGTDRRTSASALQRQAPASSATDAVRVFVYDPAAATTELEQSLARFDAIVRTTVNWEHINQPPGVPVGALPTVGFLNGLSETGHLRSEIIKPLPTGGVAGITFRADQSRSGSPGAAVDPANLMGLELSFEQPLLQGGGVLINQVRDFFPAALNLPIPSGAVPPSGRVPGILITRITARQAQIEFERRVQELLFVVEESYWDLVAAYWDLYSRDSGLRQAYLAWQVAQERFKAGGLASDELAQIEEQFHTFRTQRLEALGRGTPGRPGVLEAERRLRYVTGLPADDGQRLIPLDAPLTTPLAPDWQAAVDAALANRPELQQAAQEVRLAWAGVLRASDYLRPDLRLTSRVSVNGLGTSAGDGLHNLGDNPFAALDVGVQFQSPVGYRAAHAELSRARLALAQRYAFQHDQEEKVVSSLLRSYRDVIQFREEMVTRHSQREAVAVQLKTRYAKFRAKGEVTGDLLVRTQRNWADALRDEYVAICRYNVALADLERQKGTIMSYHNVSVVEGTLPGCAQADASRRVRQATEETLARDESLRMPGRVDESGAECAELPDTLIHPHPVEPLRYLQSDERR